MTDALFDEIDTDHSNTISLDELKTALEASPEAFAQLQLSASRLLHSPKWRRPAPASSKADGSRWDEAQEKSTLLACVDCRYARRSPTQFVWLWMYIVAVAACYAYGSLDSMRRYVIEEKSEYLVLVLLCCRT